MLREQCSPQARRGQLMKKWRTQMGDLIFVAVTIGFFALSIAYAYACGKL